MVRYKKPFGEYSRFTRLQKLKWTARLHFLECGGVFSHSTAAASRKREALSIHSVFVHNTRFQGRRTARFNSYAILPRLKSVRFLDFWGNAIAPQAEFLKLRSSSLVLERLRTFFVFNSVDAIFARIGVFKCFWLLCAVMFCCLVLAPTSLELLVLGAQSLLDSYDINTLEFWRHFTTPLLFVEIFNFFYFSCVGVVNAVDYTRGISTLLDFHFNYIDALSASNFENMFAYSGGVFSRRVWVAVSSLYSSDYFLTGLLASQALLWLTWHFVVTKLILVRGDLWSFFVSMLYQTSWVRRISSLEALNQLLGGQLTRVINRRSWFSTFLKKFNSTYPSNNATQLWQLRYLEYFFAQTVGGAVGFLDFFPGSGAAGNVEYALYAKLKSRVFFRKTRGYLRYKIATLTYYIPKLKNLSVTTNPRVKFLVNPISTLARTSTFFRPRTYPSLVYIGSIGQRVLSLLNISRVGDISVNKLRKYFFDMTTINRDPWDDHDPVDGKAGPRERMAVNTNVRQINWYGRELDNVVLAQTLNTRFASSVVRRFRFKIHNSVNDYSFWKPEVNLVGKNVYFSTWDTFAVENQFDTSELRRSRYDLFESLNSEEDLELELDYVIEDNEVFFEDNLLHKDFALIYFEEQHEDLITRGGTYKEMLDELDLQDFNVERLRSILNNESLLYGAGQEGDHSIKTDDSFFRGAHSPEYVSLKERQLGWVDTVYDDLVDHLVLNAEAIAPRVFSIPANRSVFYWGHFSKFEKFEISERDRLGRFFYFYWQLASTLFVPKFHNRWVAAYFMFAAWLFFIFLLVGGFVFFSIMDIWLTLYNFWDLIFFTGLFGLVFCFVFFVGNVSSQFVWDMLTRYSLTYVTTLVVLRGFISLSCCVMPQARLSRLLWARLRHNERVSLRRRGLVWRWGSYTAAPAFIFNWVRNSFYEFTDTFSAGVTETWLILKLSQEFTIGVPNSTLTALTRLRYKQGLGWCNTSYLGWTRPLKFLASQSAFIYHGMPNWFGGLRPASVTACLPLYDFRFNNENDVCANFIFESVLQEHMRVLRKQNSFLETRKKALMVRSSMQLLQLNESRGWETFVANLMFSTLQFSAGNFTATSNELNAVSLTGPQIVGKERALLKSRVGVAQQFPVLDSRNRSKMLNFFEETFGDGGRDLSMNFLRFFISREMLRFIYRRRSNRTVVSFSKWSYVSKIRWTVFATPLHGGGWANKKYLWWRKF